MQDKWLLDKIVMYYEQSKKQYKNGFAWTFRDSNPGPTGYEPIALTN